MYDYLKQNHVSANFLPAAANDTGVYVFFKKEELEQIQAAIYPYGGSFTMKDITLSGVLSGQRIEIYTPVSGNRPDSHVIDIVKFAVSDTDLNYAARDIFTNAIFPSNDFHHALKVGMQLIRRFDCAPKTSRDYRP